MNLAGSWIVPSSADAHTHTPAAYNIDAVREAYLCAGVCYVQALSNS